MDLVALLIALLSLAVAGVGTVLANRRASEAIAESRKAAASTLWSGIQEAVQRMIGFDPNREPIGERLNNLRIAGIALVDELDDWAGLDTWLEAERVLGAVLGRRVLERSQPGDTVDERLEVLDPLMRWAQVLGSNLRRFRKMGYDPAVARELQEHAEDQVKRVSEANGWPLPPRTIPGLRTIDGS